MAPTTQLNHDIGLSHILTTRESLTPVPFYCIFLPILRLKRRVCFYFFFCMAPPYVSGLWLKGTQVFVSHAGSTFGKKKPSSGPSWPLIVVCIKCSAGDHFPMGSDFSALSNSHSTPSLARSYHAWLIRHSSTFVPWIPPNLKLNLSGNQSHPLQADLV